MRLPAIPDVEEAQQRAMDSRQGRQFVEAAAQELYQCALACEADGVTWPDDLDEAHAILWRHLGRPEELRQGMVRREEER